MRERLLLLTNARNFPVSKTNVDRISVTFDRIYSINKLLGPVDGGWSEWRWPVGKCFPKSESRPVKVTQTQRRYCNSPEPQHGGQNCTGEETGETRDCYHTGEGEWKLTSLTESRQCNTIKSS